MENPRSEEKKKIKYIGSFFRLKKNKMTDIRSKI